MTAIDVNTHNTGTLIVMGPSIYGRVEGLLLAGGPTGRVTNTDVGMTMNTSPCTFGRPKSAGVVLSAFVSTIIAEAEEVLHPN
jgi:hypothetical protein